MNFDQEFETAIRIITKAMPLAKNLIKPTLFHSIRVGTYLYSNDYSREICIAGLLHDALEDTDLTKKFLCKEFGNEVYSLVQANSKDFKLPVLKQGKELILRCINHSQAALIIKSADIIDNLIYFNKTKHSKAVTKMLKHADLVLTNKRSEYTDPIFNKLKTLSENIKNK